MAIWQYTFRIIPKGSFDNGIFQPKYSQDGLIEDDIYWERVPTKKDFFYDIGKVLPIGSSWCEDILLFGSEDSNCFEVLYENNYAVSVSFRVHFTIEYEFFLRHVLDFIRFNNLLLLDGQHEIIEPDYLSIKHLMENSRQAKLYDRLSAKE
ncbi:MAG: hypothetical protein AAF518_22635 [Spirochaetota bacterium]